MAKIKLIGYRCERCNHKWVSRSKVKEPVVCPNCKSPYWNRPRIRSHSEKNLRKKGITKQE